MKCTDKYVIKAITYNGIISYLGGSDGCNYLKDIGDAQVYSSKEEAARTVLENFEVTQLDNTTYRHTETILATIFLLIPVQYAA